MQMHINTWVKKSNIPLECEVVKPGGIDSRFLESRLSLTILLTRAAFEVSDDGAV